MSDLLTKTKGFIYYQMRPYTHDDEEETYKNICEWLQEDIEDNINRGYVSGPYSHESIRCSINFIFDDSCLYDNNDMDQAIAVIACTLYLINHQVEYDRMFEEAYWTIEALKTGKFDELFTEDDLFYLSKDIATIEAWFDKHRDKIPAEPRIYSIMETKGNHSFPFGTYLVGTQYIKDIENIEINVGDNVVLKREHDNKYDINAVAVYSSCDKKIGYIRQSRNEVIAFWMDKGKKATAKVASVGRDGYGSRKIKVILNVEL